MRHDRFERVAGADFLAADYERDVEALRRELVEATTKLLSFRAARLVAADGLVVGLRDAEDAVGAYFPLRRRPSRRLRSWMSSVEPTLILSILGLGAVAVTQVAYEVEGWGVGELVVVDDRVVWHELPWPRPEGTGSNGTGVATNPSQTPTHPGLGAVVPENQSRRGRDFVAEVVQLLQRYFAGDRVLLEEVPVDLEYETAFFGRCAIALRTIPRGEAVSYGELAALAGAPGAARTAGSFCARNRLGLFVPCHRVVSAGGLGPYGSYGAGYKRRLLTLEGYSGAL